MKNKSFRNWTTVAATTVARFNYFLRRQATKLLKGFPTFDEQSTCWRLALLQPGTSEKSEFVEIESSRKILSAISFRFNECLIEQTWTRSMSMISCWNWYNFHVSQSICIKSDWRLQSCWLMQSRKLIKRVKSPATLLIENFSGKFAQVTRNNSQTSFKDRSNREMTRRRLLNWHAIKIHFESISNFSSSVFVSGERK